MPVVSIRDPARPDGAAAPPVEEPGRSHLPALVAAAVVLVAAGGATASLDVRSERAAEQRRAARAAAELARDTVHLSARVESTRYASSGPGWLHAVVRVDDDGTEGYADHITGMRLAGAALVPAAEPAAPAALRAGDRVRLSAALDCREVARGRLPQTPAVTVTVVTAAGRPHDLLVPLRPPGLRGAALAACGLPDPVTVAPLTP
jgi:hypothetical protein